jgi:serine/threonine protein kinase
MNKIIYNEKLDIIYLLIYVLGSGTSSTIWYCIEIKDYVKTLKQNKGKFNINCKALKIFKEERDKEYKREVDINDIITFEDKKSEYVNYNDGGLKYKDDMIIINEVMAISLYDMCKLLKFDFEDEYKENIYEQMKKGIEYIHKCGYLHADIKMENFLVCGLNILQKKIIDYVNKYDFSKFFKKKNNKNGNLIQSTNDKLLSLIDDVIFKFNLEEIIDEDYESDFEESNEDNMEESIEESIEESDNESISSYSSYSTNASSFDSEFNEFDIKYDKFHINEINNFILNLDNNEVENKNRDIEKDIKFYKEKLKDIKIKLTDFGLIKKPGGMETIQTRVFRSPRNILGFSCEFSDDIYALEQNKYELFNGKLLIDLESDKNFNKYNNNLLTIKKIFKINNNIYYDILQSKRINSILSKDGSFLFK